MFITIQTTEDNKLQVGASPDLDFNQTMQMLHTLNLHMLNAFAKVYEKNIKHANETKKDGSHKLNKEELEEAVYNSRLQIYDSFNIAVSSVLDLFFKEANVWREDITLEAIQETELKILDQKIKDLQKDKPHLYKANVEHLKRTKAQIEKAREEYHAKLSEMQPQD